MAVSKSLIVEASIRILNRDGIEGLSMRTIAKELGIKAASLYNHIGGRQELYGEIAEAMCLRYRMPEVGLAPQDYLINSYQAYRSMLKTVRDSVAIHENSIPNTPRRVEIIQGILVKLMEFGVVTENLLTISNMLNNYTLSFTADELRYGNAQPEVRSALAAMPGPGGKPIFTGEIDFDRQFSNGLEVLFAGIQAYR